MAHHVALSVALALAAGMTVQCVARSLRVPAIILLLAAGVALGPEGLGWVHPAELGEGLFTLVDFAIAIILFEGGLNLKATRLRREQRVIRRLVTLGALVTLAGGTIAARFWFGWPWTLSVLFGSLVVVTGPTVVTPLVRQLRLVPRVQTILEAEGVLIDPIGALLAALVLQVTIVGGSSGVVGELGALLGRVATGVGFGVAGGLLISGVLRTPSLVHGFENALTLALVVLLFHVSDVVIAPSGLLAVTIAGLVVGNLKSPVDEDLREFKDQLTVLMVGAVFILLAANVAIADVRALGWAGVGVLASLILIVRPCTVWLASRGSDVTRREQIFLGAMAPRGIIAAAIASLTARALGAQAAQQAGEMRALVFLVIAGTVLAAGTLAWPLATLLRLRLPARDRIAILGAQGLGLALGRELLNAGHMVILIEADPQRCRAAEQKGFQVIFGDGLHERTLRRVPIEHVGTAIGLTFNDHLNSQFVRLARQSFGVKTGLVSVETLDGTDPPQHVARQGADVLFGGAHDQERWDVRWRQGDVDVVAAEWTGPIESTADATQTAAPRPVADSWVTLTISRGGRVSPMSLSVRPKSGDVAAIGIFRRERDATIERLRTAGWTVREAATEDAGRAGAQA